MGVAACDAKTIGRAWKPVKRAAMLPDPPTAFRATGARRNSPMLNQPLLGLHGIVFRSVEGVEAGPIHLTIHRRERILLRCAADPVYDAFIEVLAGTRQPLHGRLVEHERVRLQIDRRLRQNLNLNRSIRELNAAAKLPESLWIGQRRRSLFGVMDRLGIDSRHMHSPLKLEPARIQDKYWALRLIASDADLLVGREIFSLEDPLIREVITLSWSDLRGAVIYAGPPERIPAPPDTILALNDDGTVSVLSGGSGTDEDEPEPAERRPPEA
jgi:hypothetical protein